MFNSGLYLPILIFAFCFFFLAICRQCRDKVKKICQEEKLTNCQVDSSTKKVQERTSSLHATKQCSDLSIDDCDRKECEGIYSDANVDDGVRDRIFLNSMGMAIALRVAFIVVVKAMTSAKFKCPVALVIVVVTIVRVAMIILVAITLVMREMLALTLIIRKMTAVIMFALWPLQMTLLVVGMIMVIVAEIVVIMMFVVETLVGPIVDIKATPW